jgi:hypothetical protein
VRWWRLGFWAAVALGPGCGPSAGALCDRVGEFCPDVNRQECRERLEHVNNGSLFRALEDCLNRSRSCPEALSCLAQAGGIIPPVGRI